MGVAVRENPVDVAELNFVRLVQNCVFLSLLSFLSHYYYRIMYYTVEPQHINALPYEFNLKN